MTMVGMEVRKLWSTECEQAVIGACLLDGSVAGDVLAAGLRAEHFYDPQHCAVWGVIAELEAEGKCADLITLSERLQLGKVPVDSSYLLALSDNTPASSNAKQYAQVVLDRARERDYSAVLSKALEGFRDPAEPDPIARAEQLLTELDEGRVGSALVPIEQVAREYVAVLEERHKNPGLVGLRTGYSNIDNRLGALKDGDLGVIAARPGMGKTNYVLNIARQVATQFSKKRVLGFSMEMGNSQLFERLVAAQGKVKKGLLQTGKVFEHTDSTNRMVAAVTAVGKTNMALCDAATMTVQELCSLVRAERRSQEIGLVFVDYLGLLDCAGDERRHDLMIGQITRSLKKLARDVGCPVLLLAQLSRRVEERKDRRPILSDLKDSGSIEADADFVQFLYRDAYYDEDSSSTDVEVITAKCREGEIGSDYLTWQGEYALMESKSTRDIESQQAVDSYNYKGDF